MPYGSGAWKVGLVHAMGLQCRCGDRDVCLMHAVGVWCMPHGSSACDAMPVACRGCVQRVCCIGCGSGVCAVGPVRLWCPPRGAGAGNAGPVRVLRVRRA